MEKFKLLLKINELYSKGENIIEYLKKIENRDFNTIEDILISYDFQSGSYIRSYAENIEFKHKYCSSLAKIINDLGVKGSIMEIGVGEATTLGPLVKLLNFLPEEILGFDISWSRLKFAGEFLNDNGISNVSLFSANLFEIPLQDNSIDIIYTSHSIEPNGGNEEPALEELYRVAGKYLVLLEPAFEFAGEEAKRRMLSHGYVRNLFSTAKRLGFKISEYRLFDYSANPLNPTGLMIIEKQQNSQSGSTELVCPLTRTKLTKYTESLLYSIESMLAYPVIDGIPCLLKENSILATHLLTDYKKFKLENKI